MGHLYLFIYPSIHPSSAGFIVKTNHDALRLIAVFSLSFFTKSITQIKSSPTLAKLK